MTFNLPVMKAVATFPPMEVGREHVLTLKLSNRTNLKPVTGADVYFHASVRRREDSSSHHAGSHETERVADVNIKLDVTDAAAVERTRAPAATPSSPTSSSRWIWTRCCIGSRTHIAGSTYGKKVVRPGREPLATWLAVRL